MLKNIIITLLTVIFLIGGIYFLQKSAPAYLQILEPKTELKNLPLAPDFELMDLNGQKIKLSDFKGKKIILNFWASWDAASIRQLKTLDNYFKSPASQETVILAANSLENKTAVEKIKTNNGLELEILLDSEGKTGELYELGVLPLTFIIDKGGLITKRIIGPAIIKTITE
ncbi:MAG: redoxin domain-containing protein [Candidatus Brennerbacteria bacterium]|nr:redoxin domain-containing protein [Candidatus Brennerbacteria bacterium]